MNTIHKYLTKELLKYFFIVLITVVSIFLAVDFFEKIDKVLNVNLPLPRILAYFGLRIPSIIAQLTPVAILLAVLTVFGLMVKNNEIVALKSGGVSTPYLFKPVLVLGLIFSALLLFFDEVLVPMTASGANRIWKDEIRRGSAVTTKKKNMWIKGHRSILHIRYFEPSDRMIFGVTLNLFDDRFRLEKRVDAERGVYVGGRWYLFNVIEQNLVGDEEGYEMTHREQIPVDLEFLPADLTGIVKKGEEMTYTELSSYIQNVEEEGYDATSYKVDLGAKIAFPFICVIMSVLGSGLALRRTKREGLAGSIFLGIVVAFLYWTTYSFCLSLGYGGVFPPIIAAWLANVLFACLGTFILLRAN